MGHKIKKVMSLAIMPDLHEKLKNFSNRKGISASTYIGNLIEKAVKLNIDDDVMMVGKPSNQDIIPVLLKIPTHLKNDPENLKEWLDAQVNGIFKALTKKVL